jgi:hypothetical protein
MLAAAALIGCDMIDTDENTELNGDNNQQTTQDDSIIPFLTSFNAAETDDVSLDGVYPIPALPVGFDDEASLADWVLLSALSSTGEGFSAVEKFFTNIGTGSRSIEAVTRLRIEEEDMQLEDTTLHVDHMDLEFAGGMNNLSDFLSHISEDSSINYEIFRNILLSGKIGISTFMSMATNSIEYPSEPIDSIFSLFLDINVEDLDISGDYDSGSLPQFSGTLIAEFAYSVATNLLVDYESGQTTRIPSTISLEMKPLEGSLESIMTTIFSHMQNDEGFEALLADEDTFLGFCNDIWETENETGFITLCFEMEAYGESGKGQLVDYEIIEMLVPLIQKM